MRAKSADRVTFFLFYRLPELFDNPGDNHDSDEGGEEMRVKIELDAA